MTTTTLRLPAEMAQAVRLDATAQGTTVNELIRTLISRYLKEQEDKRIYDGFTLLGNYPEETDVEFAFHAGAEVILRDE